MPQVFILPTLQKTWGPGTRPDQLFGRGARGVPDGCLNSLFAPKEISKELEVPGRSETDRVCFRWHYYCFAPA